MSDQRMSWDALVLAGGSARRLGGVDKSAVTIGNQTLLERLLAAVGDAGGVVVVGPRRPLAVSRRIVWTREQPLAADRSQPWPPAWSWWAHR